MDVEDYRIDEEEEEEEEEEESMDIDYDENKAAIEFEEEEEEVEDLKDMTSPFVSSWIDYDAAADGGKKIVDGIIVIDDDIHNPKNKCQLDDCSICYQPWTCRGKHRICSLPCGHIYGLSCIKKWLLQSPSAAAKCPQCNTLCAYDDVVPLYASASLLCVADHQKASTRRFPFTRQGATDFKHYATQQCLDALDLFHDEQKHLSNVVKHQHDAATLSCKLEAQWDDMLTQTEKSEEQAKDSNDSGDAARLRVRLRADALKRRADEFARCADALARRADALERRLDALERRVEASKSNIFFFLDMYVAHHKKNTDPCAFSLTTLMQQLHDDFFPSSGADISTSKTI